MDYRDIDNFTTLEEAEEWYFINVYPLDEKEADFKNMFRQWMTDNDIMILEENIDDADFTGVTNEDR